MRNMTNVSRLILTASAGLAIFGSAVFAAQQGGPRPPALTFSGPVPPQYLINPQSGSRFGVHDHMTVSAEVAERLAHVCEDFARQHNATATIVVLDIAGRIIHEHRMDGQSFLNQRAAEEKAKTALLTREPSRVITGRVYEELATQMRMEQFGLNPQQGGLPIIVNDQIIGAIGVGGGAGGEELCAKNALEQVFGPQPPTVAAPAGVRDGFGGVFQRQGANNQGGG
jgi:glc operon protein GlcG